MTTFFNVNKILFKWAGLWIPDQSTSLPFKIWYCLYNGFWIMYSCVIFTPAELLSFKYTFTNMKDFIKNVNMGMTHFLANIKVFLWFHNRSKIFKIIDTLSAYEGFYEPYGDFHPDQLIKEERKLKDGFTVTFLCLALSVSVSACIASFKVLIFDNNQFNSNVNETVLATLKLPYFSLIPFDYTKSQLGYSAAILYQGFSVFNFGWMIVGFDTLYVALVSYISAQLLIVQGAFRTLRQRCHVKLRFDPQTEPLQEYGMMQEAMDKEIIRVTEHFQTILKMCKEIEDLFTFVTLAQTLISLVVLCTCLFMVSLVPMSSVAFITELVYFIAVSCQLFVYCYFGNKVRLNSDGIPLAIYEMNWFATTVSFKRTMLINMGRMQKPIFFTIGKFSPLTLSTFATIMRGSYSFFAVLKNRT